jgi:geranylgeranyl pyrophosphate synthase
MVTLADIAPAPPSMDAFLRDGLLAVSRVMDDALGSGEPAVAELVDHVGQYRGKMLRPALALVAGAAVRPGLSVGDERFAEVAGVAAVTEIIHVATLVHDDVLDEAETRRGRPSVNAMSGNEVAVILGDYLFARSYHLCSTLPVRDPEGRHTATRVGDVTTQVCQGEMLQLSNRRNASLTMDEYFRIIEQKTGALIAAAAELGALHAGGSVEQAVALGDFGRRLGAAFQIRDDLLDVEGDERKVGKPLGRDLMLGKLTLPVIHHLAVRNGAADDLRESIDAGQRLIDSGRLIERLNETGSINHTQAVAEELVRQAVERLAVLPTSPARSYLERLARAVLSRSA